MLAYEDMIRNTAPASASSSTPPAGGCWKWSATPGIGISPIADTDVHQTIVTAALKVDI